MLRQIERIKGRIEREKNLFTEYININENKFLENSKILRKYLQTGSSKTVANIIY